MSIPVDNLEDNLLHHPKDEPIYDDTITNHESGLEASNIVNNSLSQGVSCLNRLLSFF